jgi:predicted dinucleotide-binding enzyme
MKIGIIGAGHIGSALALRLTQFGHEVSIANSRGPDSLRDVAAETGAVAVDVAGALQGAELAVLTIPMKNVPLLPAGLFSALSPRTPVVDTCNYYPRERDGRIAAIEDGEPESQWVGSQIGHPVVKAFNCIFAQHLRDLGVAPGTPKRIALPVAGDDADAVATVMQLVDALGFDPVDAAQSHSPGGSSPARLSTARIWTRLECEKRWKMRPSSARSSGAPHRETQRSKESRVQARPRLSGARSMSINARSPADTYRRLG